MTIFVNNIYIFIILCTHSVFYNFGVVKNIEVHRKKPDLKFNSLNS